MALQKPSSPIFPSLSSSLYSGLLSLGAIQALKRKGIRHCAGKSIWNRTSHHYCIYRLNSLQYHTTVTASSMMKVFTHYQLAAWPLASWACKHQIQHGFRLHMPAPFVLFFRDTQSGSAPDTSQKMCHDLHTQTKRTPCSQAYRT